MNYKMIIGFAMISIFVAFVAAVGENGGLAAFLTTLGVMVWLFTALALILS